MVCLFSTCVRAYMSVCFYVGGCTCRVCASACPCKCLYVCLFVYVFMCTSVCMYVCLCVCVLVSVCVCLYKGVPVSGGCV